MASLRAVWKLSTGSALCTTPAVSHAQIYCGLSDKQLCAATVSDGKIVWRTKLKAPPSGPIVHYKDLVLVRAEDGALHALDAKTGAARWEHNIGRGKKGEALSLAQLKDHVFFSFEGQTRAFDLATRTPLWSVAGELIAVAGSQALLATRRPGLSPPGAPPGKPPPEMGGLHLISLANGQERWRALFTSPVTHAVIDGENVCAASEQKVAALAAKTGQFTWQQVLPGEKLALASIGKVVAVATGKELHALAHRDGKLAWQRKVKKPVAALLVDNDKLLVAADSISAVDHKSGKDATKAAVTNPRQLLTDEERLYVCDAAGRIQAFRRA